MLNFVQSVTLKGRISN